MTDEDMVVAEDDALVRWVAMLLVEGKSESEIRRLLTENAVFESATSPDGWSSLMFAGTSAAMEMKSLAISRAELDSTDYLRLDSYVRRKQNIERLERLVEKAEGMADSVSKLNSVSFMVGGVMNAQDKMDKLTGAATAQPQVVVNVGYDPLDQFRTVIQQEASEPRIIEVTPVVESEPDESEEE
tara:strand:- start:1038 stop:1592 length:555 start_codon:yes stop_codon:yes gene_type:complete